MPKEEILSREINKDGYDSWFVRCRSYCHLLQVSIHESDIGDPNNGIVTIQIYGHDQALNFQTRLRRAWEVLLNGYGGDRDVVLDHEEALALGEKIIELAKKVRE